MRLIATPKSPRAGESEMRPALSNARCRTRMPRARQVHPTLAAFEGVREFVPFFTHFPRWCA